MNSTHAPGDIILRETYLYLVIKEHKDNNQSCYYCCYECVIINYNSIITKRYCYITPNNTNMIGPNIFRDYKL